MFIIDKFKLDKTKKNSFENIKELKSFIDSFFLQSNYKKFILDTSRILDLDENVLLLKSKRLLLQKFNYQKNIFDQSLGFLKIIFELLAFLIIFIKIIFGKRKNKISENDLILFNIDNFEDIEKFKKILSSFNSSIIITKKKIDFDNISDHIQDSYLKKNLIINYKKNYLDLRYRDKNEKYLIKTNIINDQAIKIDSNCIQNKFQVFKFALRLFFNSIKLKFNLLELFNRILYSKIKNYSIFKTFKAKYILQDRINYTCSVRNYLFKKMGGLASGCVQTHLSEASISLFNDIDLFFTFGDEQNSKNLLTLLGSRVKKSLPVGSLRLESYFNNSSKEFNYDKEIDILVFGVNLYTWLYINNNSKINYYKFLNYIRKLAEVYKDLRIAIKHHPYYINDDRELEIMKGSKVIYLDKKINSYSLIKNSKLFLSYSSTMIVETNAIFGKSYFLDPNNCNNVFFDKNYHLNKIKLVDLFEIKKIIDSTILNKDNQKKIFSDICLDSKNVSELIVKNLKVL